MVRGGNTGGEGIWVTEDEMLGWHHRFNGREFEQTLGDGEGQGSLVCCSAWGSKVSDTTERLDNTVGRGHLQPVLPPG